MDFDHNWNLLTHFIEPLSCTIREINWTELQQPGHRDFELSIHSLSYSIKFEKHREPSERKISAVPMAVGVQRKFISFLTNLNVIECWIVALVSWGHLYVKLHGLQLTDPLSLSNSYVKANYNLLTVWNVIYVTSQYCAQHIVIWIWCKNQNIQMRLFVRKLNHSTIGGSKHVWMHQNFKGIGSLNNTVVHV